MQGPTPTWCPETRRWSPMWSFTRAGARRTSGSHPDKRQWTMCSGKGSYDDYHLVATRGDAVDAYFKQTQNQS